MNRVKPQRSGTERSGTEPSGTEPSGTEPSRTEPSRTEPSGTEPARTRPAGARPRLRAAGLALAALTAAAVAAGCTTPAANPPAPVASGTAASKPAAAASGSPAASTAASTAAATCNPEASSLAPLGPAQVAPGSYMATIRARGHLIAGVDQNTFHFEYLNPLDGQFEGFDIDMIRAVAQAIFGNPNAVQYKAITDDERITDIQKGSVDIVAHTMTITCARLLQVDFSSVYFDAHQQVLVLDNSTATGVASLAGQKVCATKGSDSIGNIEAYPSHPQVVQVPYITDCLVKLQQGQVAAITSDNSILEGLAAQDPFTKIVGPYLSNEPYGLAISKGHPEFVRFVNAVLAKERADGWQASYRRWVGNTAPQPPPAQYAS
jgi:polar amino acid transport system substrate-binding protein